MVGEKNTVKLEVLGYTDTDYFDDDEHSAVGYTSDYVEIEVSLVEEYDLTEAFKAKDNVDKCTDKIIKLVADYTIKYIEDDIVSFNSLAYSSTVHEKSEIPLEFYTDNDMNEDTENDNDNGIIISLSLSEAFPQVLSKYISSMELMLCK